MQFYDGRAPFNLWWGTQWSWMGDVPRLDPDEVGWDDKYSPYAILWWEGLFLPNLRVAKQNPVFLGVSVIVLGLWGGPNGYRWKIYQDKPRQGRLRRQRHSLCNFMMQYYHFGGIFYCFWAEMGAPMVIDGRNTYTSHRQERLRWLRKSMCNFMKGGRLSTQFDEDEGNL